MSGVVPPSWSSRRPVSNAIIAPRGWKRARSDARVALSSELDALRESMSRRQWKIRSLRGYKCPRFGLGTAWRGFGQGRGRVFTLYPSEDVPISGYGVAAPAQLPSAARSVG